MQTRVHSTIDFSVGGNSTQHTIAGWSIPEPSHTWMVGASSSLIVERPRAPFGFLVEIDWGPATNRPFRTVQSFVLEVNGRFAAAGAVDAAEIVAFNCPPLLNFEPRMLLTFHHPNAYPADEVAGSSDTRELSLCVRRIRVLTLTAPWMRQPPVEASSAKITATEVPAIVATAERITNTPVQTMLHGFEMLSGNCDMGLALRAVGFEKISLLRFGGASTTVAMKGLETDFEGLGQAMTLSVAHNPLKEWMVADDFGLNFHSGVSSESIEEAALLKKLKPYLALLRRKFLGDLDEGVKVFVFADHKNYYARRGIEHVLPLYLALKRRSPKAKLLWVCPTFNDPAKRGSVQLVASDLAIGQLDITASPILPGGGITVTGWLNVLCNAWNAFAMRAEDLSVRAA